MVYVLLPRLGPLEAGFSQHFRRAGCAPSGLMQGDRDFAATVLRPRRFDPMSVPTSRHRSLTWTHDQQATSALFEKACQCRTSNAFARCRGRTLHKRRHRAATGCTVQHGADGRGAGTRAELGAGADRRVGRGACRGPQRDAEQRLYVGPVLCRASADDAHQRDIGPHDAIDASRRTGRISGWCGTDGDGCCGGMLAANAIGGMFARPAEAGEVLPKEEPDLGDDGFLDDSDWSSRCQFDRGQFPEVSDARPNADGPTVGAFISGVARHVRILSPVRPRLP